MVEISEKVVVSAKVDKDLIKTLRFLRIPYTDVIRLAISTIASLHLSNYEMEMYFKMLNIEVEEHRLMAMKEKIKEIESELDNRIEELRKLRTELNQELNKVRVDSRLALLYRNLNKALKECNYDKYELINKHKWIIDEIKAYDEYFDLDRHIDRMKQLSKPLWELIL